MRLLIATLSLIIAPSLFAKQAIIPSPPQLQGTSWLLMDANTGEIIVEQNADMKVPPASLTKMMTSYALSYELAQGQVSKDDMVRISKNAWAQNPLFNGSSLMWIEVNKQVSIEDLHRGIVIPSGNDASLAIAEHISGSEEAFVDVMNQHASLLGMVNTNFANSHGLPAEGHTTTARDMAILGRALIQDFPEDYALYKEKEFTFNKIKQSNRNRLLWWDQSVDGLKTGHTEEAGYCLVASAERDGMRLISVLMGAKSDNARARESQKLLSYGFRYYQSYLAQEGKEAISRERVWGGESEFVELRLKEALSVTIPRGSVTNIKRELDVEPEIVAPIKAGQKLGDLVLSLNGQEIARKPLLAAKSIAEAGMFASLWDSIALFFHRMSN
ncbi:MAG: D-alanyl-D-alanine carboxypeptidase [Cellvibrionaceae bacterium]